MEPVLVVVDDNVDMGPGREGIVDPWPGAIDEGKVIAFLHLPWGSSVPS